MKHADLIRRLEAGETGWPINGEIYLALFPNEGYNFQPMADKIRVDGWLVDSSRGQGFQGYNRKIHVDPLTTSLDAAVALVERVRPGWYWDVSKVFPSGNMRAGLNPPPVQHGEHWLRDIGAIAFSSTPAAALVAALLRSEG